MEHFRVRRHIAYDLAIHFEASQEFNETTGGHGKITAYNQVCRFGISSLYIVTQNVFY